MKVLSCSNINRKVSKCTNNIVLQLNNILGAWCEELTPLPLEGL